VKDPFFLAQLARGGYEETVGTKMGNGIEARNGINAAQLAMAGWAGVKDPFFGERGGYYPASLAVIVQKESGKTWVKNTLWSKYLNPGPAAGRPMPQPRQPWPSSIKMSLILTTLPM